MTRLHLSESPLGASPAAVAAARAELERVNRYPSPQRDDVVAALARHWNVHTDQIAVGNGSDELVLACALSLGDRSRSGLVTAGTFPGYASSLGRVGRGAVAVPLRGTAVDAAGFAARLGDHGIGYLCNPHNPSGAALTTAELSTLVDAAAAAEVPLVFDEAYHEFGETGLPQARDLADADAPVLALRTFSKAYGLAALRIGYAVGRADLIAEVRATLATLPFSVNRLAQAAAVAALADQGFLSRLRRDTAARRDWFGAELDHRGRRHLPSVTNFIAVAASDPAKAQDVLAAEHRILVRDAGMFGFDGYLRVSLGTKDELLAFLAAIDDIDPLN